MKNPVARLKVTAATPLPFKNLARKNDRKGPMPMEGMKFQNNPMAAPKEIASGASLSLVSFLIFLAIILSLCLIRKTPLYAKIAYLFYYKGFKIKCPMDFFISFFN